MQKTISSSRISQNKGRFNRYEALKAEFDRLKASKIGLLQSTCSEMNRLRTFIQFLSMVDQEKPLPAHILVEIHKFTTLSTPSSSSSSSSSNGNNVDQKENIREDDIDIDPPLMPLNRQRTTDYEDITTLQEDIKRLRESKMELIRSSNQELNTLRQCLHTLMNHLNQRYPIEPIIKVTEDGVDRNLDKDKIANSASMATHWRQKCQVMAKDKVVNVLLLGTKNGGKSALLRNIVLQYGGSSQIRQLQDCIDSDVVNSIVSNMYNLLATHSFFENQKNKIDKEVMHSIEYFKDNRLKRFHNPMLTADICQHLEILYNDTTIQKHIAEHNDFHNLAYYFKDINKYGRRNWNKESIVNEDILYICNDYKEKDGGVSYTDIYLGDNMLRRETDAKEIATKRRDSGYGLEYTGSYFHGAAFGGIDNYYQDLWNNTEQKYDDITYIEKNDNTPTDDDQEQQNNREGGKVYRIWDISSQCDSATREVIFKNIPISCFVYVTSPVFCYETDVSEKKTRMQLSLELFRDIFVEPNSTPTDGDEQIVKNMQAPIIILLNKCDLFKKDISPPTDNPSENFKSLLLSFPDYDGGQSYDESIRYLRTLFNSMNANKKRPFHIYETSVLDTEKTKSAVHHIQTVISLRK